MEPTRAEALARLTTFVPAAGRAYRATRNEDRGPGDRSNVSVLAPYIRARLITEEEVLRAVLAEHAYSAAEKFVQEVFWRTYWKGWLEARPAVWHDYFRDLDACYAHLASDAEAARAHTAAINARTTNAAFDAWARELVETGYLHNHARMWFASIWIFTLGLPWQLGADFFMRHLLCGDPASNTLSWRWVAGLHTRGKTYRATRDNIRRYTAGRLEPGPLLATRAPALAGPPYPAGDLPAVPTTLPSGEPVLLILHDDDVGVETLALSGMTVASSLGLLAADARSPADVSDGAIAFARGAIADGLRRAPGGEHGTILAAGDSVGVAEAIVGRARAAGVRIAVVPYAPVGPVRDALDALGPLLAERGVRLERIGRAYDALSWPHATSGFFKLRRSIPSIVRELGLSPAEA